MTKLKFYGNKFFLILFFIFLLLLDGQISFLLSSFFNYHFMISSQLLMLVAMFLYKEQSEIFTFCSFCLFGFIFESYYLGEIGIITVILPVLMHLVLKLDKQFLNSPFQTFLVYAVLMFSYNITSYVLARAYGWGNTPLAQFVTYSLCPTLIFNLLVYGICHKFLRRFI